MSGAPKFLLYLATLPGIALGHHSRFEYDNGEVAEVQGTVHAVFWRNPHIRLVVQRVTETAEEELWEMEGGPVNALERAGVAPGLIEVGDRITVLGLVSRRNPLAMLPVRVTLDGGESVILARDRAAQVGLVDDRERGNRTIAAADIESAIREANGIFRVWTNRGRTQTRSSHPLTPAARAAKEAWHQPTDDLALLCESAGMPEAMVSPFPIEIRRDGNDIVMRLEEWDNVRVIHMADATDAAGQQSSRLGYSVGRWEGGDLVVSTSKINYPFLDDVGTPQSEAVQIEERFTLSEDETRLDWTATVVDPNTFTGPTTLPNMHWEWVPGEKIKPYNCALSDELR